MHVDNICLLLVRAVASEACGADFQEEKVGFAGLTRCAVASILSRRQKVLSDLTFELQLPCFFHSRQLDISIA